MRKNSRTLYDCIRCMFTFKKKDLKKQRGMLLCDACFDTTLEIEPVNMKLRSYRANSTTTTAVNSPTVFTITTAGITFLGRSQVSVREGVRNNYQMDVVGSPTSITANPQITPGLQGTILTLVGTDDTNYVILKAGNGTDLISDMKLGKGGIITLVYSTVSSLWCETSRSTGGIYG